MDAPLSKLNQEDIKSILINYLRTQSDFTDFDYEGSNLSILLDLLAYNSKITTYNINLVANESVLETATFRDNVVTAAKRLGYNPKSYSASKVNLTINVSTATEYDKIEIVKGAVLSASNNNKTYLFNSYKLTETLRNGSVNFTLDALEGSFLRNRYTVTNTSRFIIPNNFVDIDTLSVSVIEDGITQKYIKTNSIDGLTGNDRVFFVEEIQDQKYEVIFGDGVLGRKLQNSETVIIEYLVTSGQEANSIKSFTFVGTVVGIYPNGVRENITSGITVTINSPQSFNGSNFESIPSIKFNAPRFYAAQNRAVTASDYESIIKRNFPTVKNVKAVCGCSIDKPKYGKVFIYLSLENSILDDFTKNRIREFLESYRVNGFKIELLNPEFIEVVLFIKTLFDPTKNRLSIEELKNLINSRVTEYKNNDSVKSFGGQYVNSRLITSIVTANDGITSVDIEPVLKKTVCFTLNQSSYTIDFKNPLGNCSNSNIIYVANGLYIKNYDSKVFISDDGKGKLIISAYRNNILSPIGIVGTVNYDTGVLDLVLEPDEEICIDFYAFPLNKNINALEENVLTLNTRTVSVQPINNFTDLEIQLPELEGPETTNQITDETNLNLDEFSPVPTPPDRCF